MSENLELTSNVIKGDKATIVLYHKPDDDIVKDEINNSNHAREFISVLRNVATRGFSGANVFTFKDTKKSPDCLYAWSRSFSSTVKMYVEASSYDSKPLYIVYVAGEASRKPGQRNPNVARAYVRQTQMKAMMFQGLINFATLIGPEQSQQQGVQKVAHHMQKRHNKAQQRQKS